MLYNNFIVCMMSCALLALFNMIETQNWEYVILPIGILIWGVFKFFDEDDREYLRREGIDPDKYNAFFPDLSDDWRDNHTRTYQTTPRRSGNTITWDGQDRNATFDSNLYGDKVKTWQNPVYKGMVKKCKRNFKITISEKNKNESKSERKSFFHGSNSFGW